jgi:acetolactate synthase small subunit
MAKVSVHLGFTFRVGPLETNQYSRIDVDVRDVDTELSVKDQMNEASNTLDQVWTVVREAVDEKIENVLDSGSTA